MYSSSEVTADDVLSVASLSLPVGIIRPYCFEPEHLVELDGSFSSETEDVHNHPGEKWQRWFHRRNSGDHGDTGVNGSLQQGASLHSILKFKHEKRTKR